jgi:hypothetical protein
LEPPLHQAVFDYFKTHPLAIQPPTSVREMIEGEFNGIEVEVRLREESPPRRRPEQLRV